LAVEESWMDLLLKTSRTGWLVGPLTVALVVVACTEPPTSAPTSPSAAVVVDSDVRAAYQQFVAKQLPAVDIGLVQAAKEEGAIVFYTGFYGDSHIKEFQRRFPFVKVETITLAGGALIGRFGSEKRAGLNAVDVYTAPEDGVRPFVTEGFCEKYTPTSDGSYAESDKIPNLAYRWTGSPFGIAFVPSRLKGAADYEALQHWSTLGDERWKGMTWGLVDAPPGSGAFAMWTLLYSEFGAALWEKHASLAKATRIYAGTNPTTQALVTGEIDLAANIAVVGPFGLWTTGAPVGWSTPSPLLVAPAMGCIATRPPHPNAARLYWEFLLSEDGQATLLPGNHSYRKGLDFRSAIPPKLLAEPWYRPPDPSRVVNLSAEQAAALKDTVNTAWQRIYARK
jgi:iron(III) transport system substrate-binding protein